MRLSKKYPILTSDTILKEISKEMKIPLHRVEETYRVWKMYLKDIAQKSEQTSILFPRIGTAYFLMKTHKTDITATKKTEIEKHLKVERYNNGHYNTPIYKFYGIGRLDKELNRRYTLREVCGRQKTTFKNEHYEHAEKVKIDN